MSYKIRNKKYWIAGVALVALGIAFARLLNGNFPEDVRPYVEVSGITGVVIGLFVISLGTRRSSQKSPQDDNNGKA